MQFVDSALFRGKSIPLERPVNAGRAKPAAVFCSGLATHVSNEQERDFSARCGDLASRFAFHNIKKLYAAGPTDLHRRYNFALTTSADDSRAETLIRFCGRHVPAHPI